MLDMVTFWKKLVIRKQPNAKKKDFRKLKRAFDVKQRIEIKTYASKKYHFKINV